MSDRDDYFALSRLKENADYRVLQEKWLFLISEAEKARDQAAKRGQESAWRYHAGFEKGAKAIVLALEMAMADLEAKDAEMVSESKYDDLLNEIRGEAK